MERITENKILKQGYTYGDCEARLSEYEDTGCTPEEITHKLRELDRLKARIARINDLSRNARYAITELAAEAEVHV